MNSECYPGWMHNYRITKVFPTGVLEICEKCKDRHFFHNLTPNHLYLSYHLRSNLQPSNKRFQREYAR